MCKLGSNIITNQCLFYSFSLIFKMIIVAAVVVAHKMNAVFHH